MDITYQAIECESMSDALQWADASGQGEAVLIGGEPMVVPKADLDRLDEAGVRDARRLVPHRHRTRQLK
jgi:hypothetical protein